MRVKTHANSASAGGDNETARQCMQRYLKLSATLHDSSAQVRAQEGLGKLAAAGECISCATCEIAVFCVPQVTRALLQRVYTAKQGSASRARVRLRVR